MKKNIYVSVSTDPAKGYQEILDYAKEMQGEADFLHCDVMDGNFVDKFTFDENLIKNINMASLMMLDVHLMVKEPLALIEKYIAMGANFITVHYEAFSDKNDLVKAIRLIKSKGALAGISIKPGTPFKEIKPYSYDIDLILVMSVEPGASGQKFIPEMLDKIKQISDFREENSLNFKISVDGGVNGENAKTLTEAGVDILVSGNYVFKAQDRIKAIKDLKS